MKIFILQNRVGDRRGPYTFLAAGKTLEAMKDFAPSMSPNAVPFNWVEQGFGWHCQTDFDGVTFYWKIFETTLRD